MGLFDSKLFNFIDPAGAALFSGDFSKLDPTGLVLGKSKTPDIAPVAAMPEKNGDAVKAARRRALLAQQQRSGRASTILSQDYGDKLGG